MARRASSQASARSPLEAKRAPSPKREVIVNLNVESPEALIKFAELLGETVADLYFDGKLDLG